MTTPVICRCPDGHYQRVIFDFASFNADYPEQVLLAGIVSNWCPKYLYCISFIIVSKYTIVDIQHFPKISMVQVAIERGPSQISYVKAWIVIGYGIIMGLMMMLW